MHATSVRVRVLLSETVGKGRRNAFFLHFLLGQVFGDAKLCNELQVEVSSTMPGVRVSCCCRRRWLTCDLAPRIRRYMLCCSCSSACRPTTVFSLCTLKLGTPIVPISL
jgi:hypothetical protein